MPTLWSCADPNSESAHCRKVQFGSSSRLFPFGPGALFQQPAYVSEAHTMVPPAAGSSIQPKHSSTQTERSTQYFAAAVIFSQKGNSKQKLPPRIEYCITQNDTTAFIRYAINPTTRTCRQLSKSCSSGACPTHAIAFVTCDHCNNSPRNMTSKEKTTATTGSLRRRSIVSATLRVLRARFEALRRRRLPIGCALNIVAYFGKGGQREKRVERGKCRPRIGQCSTTSHKCLR